MRDKTLVMTSVIIVSLMLSMIITSSLARALHVHASPLPGTDSNGAGLTQVTMGSIAPVVTEVGKISASLDALGTNDAVGGTIHVQKPAGATVRVAYMAVATTGFEGHKLAAGDVQIDGSSFVWSMETPSSISSWNYWGDVTSLVKSKIDAAPAGLVSFSITEVNTYLVEGEILVVVFDDPSQTTDNTVALLFGAQDVAGDTFHIGLAQPLNLSDPNLQLDLSLGISYGWQDDRATGQYSIVDVNNVRMTTSAGGEDDGASENGALITVGGIGDSNANPVNAYATPTNFRDDDELYNLLPFVNNGDTAINVFTQNPSMDDNIFFAALNLKSVVAWVGVHDVATINVTSSSSTVELGNSVSIDVTVENQGNSVETFDEDVFLNVYANTTFLARQTVSSLEPAATRTLNYVWDTTGFLTGPYKITAIASKVSGETDTSNNDYAYGMVKVQTQNMHTLSVSNYPAYSILLPFSINNTRNVSPWSGGLNQDIYDITVPSTIVDDNITYRFEKWEDDTTNPERIINLMADEDLIAYYDVSSTSSPIIYTTPIVSAVAPDKDFEINVNIANVTNLHDWEFMLYYDTRFMDRLTIAEGQFLATAGATTFQIKEITEEYNQTHGRIWLGCSLFNPSSGASGSGTLATIRFNATASGNSVLALDQTKLRDPSSTSIPHVVLQGLGLVRVKLVADVNNDGVVDIFDLVQISRSFGCVKGEPPNPPSNNGFNPHADLRQDGFIDIFDIVIIALDFGKVDP